MKRGLDDLRGVYTRDHTYTKLVRVNRYPGAQPLILASPTLLALQAFGASFSERSGSISAAERKRFVVSVGFDCAEREESLTLGANTEDATVSAAIRCFGFLICVDSVLSTKRLT